MAINNIQTALRDTLCDAFVDAIDGGAGAGLIEIWTAAFAAQLATLTFTDPAFGASSSGTATADTITGDASADATGTADVFRITTSTPTTLFEGTVGTAAEDIVFNTDSFVTSRARPTSRFRGSLSDPFLRLLRKSRTGSGIRGRSAQTNSTTRTRGLAGLSVQRSIRIFLRASRRTASSIPCS